MAEKKPTAGADVDERTAGAEESKATETEPKATEPTKPKKGNGGKGKTKLTKAQLKAKAAAERLAKKDADEAKAAKKQKAEEDKKRKARDDEMAKAAVVRTENLETREEAKAADDKKRKKVAELRAEAEKIEDDLEGPKYDKPTFEDEDTDEYWMGCMAGAPLQNITVGGMSFPLTTDRVTPGKGIRTNRSTGMGAVAVLTRGQVEKLKKAIRDRALRPGNPPIKINLKKKKLRRTDRPMGDFVYLMTTDEAADAYGTRWRETAPDCFSKTDKD